MSKNIAKQGLVDSTGGFQRLGGFNAVRRTLSLCLLDLLVYNSKEHRDPQHVEAKHAHILCTYIHIVLFLQREPPPAGGG